MGSAAHQALREGLAETERVLEARRRRSHGALAYRILACGNVLHGEQLSYKAFQKNFGRSTKVRLVDGAAAPQCCWGCTWFHCQPEQELDGQVDAAGGARYSESVLHRHLNHTRYTLAAIDDVISRGRWNDWADLRQAVLDQPSLLNKVADVCAARTKDPYAQRHHFWMHYVEKRRPAA